jgi:4'-phosphopantetheinyl transferase
MNFNNTAWENWGLKGDYVLPENEIHVRLTSLDVSPSSLAELRRTLSPDERERADRYRFEPDQRRSIISRGYLRLLLGKILDLPPDALRFEYDDFGKPWLVPAQGLLQFNVSHSGNLILIAIARGRAVGIDVEKIRTDFEMDRVAARFFSANEREKLASISGYDRWEAFFTCWTRKEAYLKAKGVGLSMPLDQFDVSFLPNEEARLLETRPERQEAERWRLAPLAIPLGYVAAVAAEGFDWKLECRSLRLPAG